MNSMVKICGLREVEHVRAAVEAGADFVGFVFAPTRRYIAPEQVSAIARELPRSVPRVGLFVNEARETVREIFAVCALDYVQLCGDETPEYCAALDLPVVKSLRVRGADVVAEVERYAPTSRWIQLDGFQPGAYGGTGTSFDWRLARELTSTYRIMLAGGLSAENVGDAIAIARPWGVDVSSGVETDGQKDVAKIRAFVAAARGNLTP